MTEVAGIRPTVSLAGHLRALDMVVALRLHQHPRGVRHVAVVTTTALRAEGMMSVRLNFGAILAMTLQTCFIGLLVGSQLIVGIAVVHGVARCAGQFATGKAASLDYRVKLAPANAHDAIGPV